MSRLAAVVAVLALVGCAVLFPSSLSVTPTQLQSWCAIQAGMLSAGVPFDTVRRRAERAHIAVAVHGQRLSCLVVG